MAPLKAARRVRRELAAYREDPPELAPEIALRDGELDRVLVLVRGAEDSPFRGGEYVLEIRLPPDYPNEPPTLRMLTPSGRFETGAKICTTFSSHHRETWNPLYTLRSLAISLVSFMLEEDGTGLGSIRASAAERRRLAAASAAFNAAKGYPKIFSDFRGTAEGAPPPT